MADRKRTPRLDWDDLRFFMELARRGTLSAAARALRVNHATVARRLSRLEATLGRELFDRSPGGFALTTEGEAVLAEAAAMEEAAGTLLGRAGAPRSGAGGLQGVVRITTTRVLADVFLVPRLAGLRERHPGLTIEVLAGSRNLSLGRREADIAIRWARPRDGDVVARRLVTVGYGLYAAPGHAASLPRGTAPSLVAYDEDGAELPESVWLREAMPGAPVALRTNSLASQAAAAKAGLGVAALPRFLAAKGDLVPFEASSRPPPSREVWMLVRRDSLRVPRVRACADHVADLFARERRLFEG